MAVLISEELRQILRDPDTVKALATVDREGNPHVTYKGSVHINERDEIEFYEMIESSRTNQNLVNSIWFSHTVSVNLLTKDKRSFLIRGIPKRVLIYGKEYENHYLKVRERFGDVDLAGVWQVEPVEVIEESFEKRRKEEEEAHPLLRHLDRLLKKEGEDTGHETTTV